VKGVAPADGRGGGIFGSVARRTPNPESDLDILVLADRLPHGRMARVKEFEPVEQALATLQFREAS